MMRVEVKPELLRWTRERSGLVRGHACGLRGHACGDTPAGYAGTRLRAMRSVALREGSPECPPVALREGSPECPPVALREGSPECPPVALQ
jgi:hypothetical protein